MEITNKKSVYLTAHIFNIKLYKNNQDIISTYILTSINMKIKQDIESIYLFMINQDIISTDFF